MKNCKNSRFVKEWRRNACKERKQKKETVGKKGKKMRYKKRKKCEST